MKAISRTSVSLVSLLLMVGVAISSVAILPSWADQTSTNDRVTSRIFSGTIDGVDPMQRLVTVQSEKKDTWMLIAVVDGEVLNGLQKGDRVVVELDEHGMAQKIVRAAPAPKDNPGIKKD